MAERYQQLTVLTETEPIFARQAATKFNHSHSKQQLVFRHSIFFIYYRTQCVAIRVNKTTHKTTPASDEARCLFATFRVSKVITIAHVQKVAFCFMIFFLPSIRLSTLNGPPAHEASASQTPASLFSATFRPLSVPRSYKLARVCECFL